MTDDLVTRLRALADTPHPTPQTQRALREAADALEAEETRRMMLNTSNGEWSKRFHALEQERDALKAKLATAEGDSDEEHHWVVYWTSRAEKAEAEAAALREALSSIVRLDPSWERRDQLCREALSQPGPGAALLEEHSRLKGIVDSLTCAFEANGVQGIGLQGCLAALLVRVKKLEAVAEAVQYESRFFKPESDLPLRVLRALAALNNE